MGHSTAPQMQYNLNELVTEHEGLEQIAVPFTKKEIDNVVKHMPVDKSTRPRWFQWDVLQEMLAYHQRRHLPIMQ